MSLTLQKQYPEFRCLEYTKGVEVTLDQAIEEINSFDWEGLSTINEGIIGEYGEPTIQLFNFSGHRFNITYSNKGFSLWYDMERKFCNKYYWADGFALEEVIELAKSFNDGDKKTIINALKGGEKYYQTPLLISFLSSGSRLPYEIRDSRGDYTKEFCYKFKIGSFFSKEVLPSLYMGLYPLIFAFAVYRFGLFFNSFENANSVFDLLLILMIFLCLVLALFILISPLILAVSFRHAHNFKAIDLTFRTDQFAAETPNEKLVLNKQDIQKIILAIVYGMKNVKVSFVVYSILVLKDGRQYFISSSVMDNEEIREHFLGIPMEENKVVVPFIKA